MKDGSEYTEYPSFTVEYRDASHSYWLLENGERTRIPSVTGICGILLKGFEIPWAEKLGAQGAIELERSGEMGLTAPENAVYRMRALGKGATAKREKRADEGTAIHAILAAYCAGEPFPPLGDFHEDIRGFGQGLAGFLLTEEPEPELSETVVASPNHGYAGRLDLIARVRGKRALIDAKSLNGSASAFRKQERRDPHIQASGYALALPECGIEPVEASYILALGDDGTWDLVPSLGWESLFLAVLYAHREVKALERTIRAAEKLAA